MANLQITYDELRREIGRFLGWDRDPANWVADQTTDGGDILRAGMRSFYWPDLGETRYAWSFLRTLTTFATVDGTQQYSVPSDFGGLLTDLAYSSSDKRTGVKRVQEELIRNLQSARDFKGPPEYCALRPIQPGEGSPTNWVVILYPTPDKAYTLSYRYAIEPEELSSSNSLHLGGAVHSETVLQAVLAAAEKTLNPEAGPAFHSQLFQQRLAASIKIDMEMQ